MERRFLGDRSALRNSQPEPNDAWNRLEIDSTASTPSMYYVVRSPGRIVPGNSTETRDQIYKHGDVWAASGTVGPTGTDEFFVNSEGLYSIQAYELASEDPYSTPTNVMVPPTDFAIRWNGQEVGYDAVASVEEPMPESGSDAPDVSPQPPTSPNQPTSQNDWLNYRSLLLGAGVTALGAAAYLATSSQSQ